MEAFKLDSEKVYRVEIKRQSWLAKTKDGVVELLSENVDSESDLSEIDVWELHKKGDRWEESGIEWGGIALMALDKI